MQEGGFTKGKNIILFILVNIVSNAVAWILAAPVLDILIYKEPVNKVFVQGMFAFFGNILIIGILGTLLMVAYSSISGKSSNLKAEE